MWNAEIKKFTRCGCRRQSWVAERRWRSWIGSSGNRMISSKPTTALYQTQPSSRAVKILNWGFRLAFYPSSLADSSKEADTNLMIGCQWRNAIQGCRWNLGTCKWLLCIWQARNLSPCFAVEMTYVSGNLGPARLGFLDPMHGVRLEIMSPNSINLYY